MENQLLILSIVTSAENQKMVQLVLEGDGHQVVPASSFEHGLSLLENGLAPNLVFLDVDRSRPQDILNYQEIAGKVQLNRICLILSPGDREIQNRARSFGITHFLMKPVSRMDLESVMNGYLTKPGPARTAPAVKEMPSVDGSKLSGSGPCLIEELGENHFFLAASPSMLEIYRQVRLLAEVDVAVLILGESGTGKEVIAHLIHKCSRRSRQRFMNVNCAALPTELLESELFGHQMGAFTGAVKDKPGKFELAHKGTLLLDEIAEMSAQMQAKLLHVLQDGQFTRLGGQQSTKVDVRILAATNVPIETALGDKTFREDLYYRLNAFTINVPPLRQRQVEIPFLIEETIRRSPAEMKSPGLTGFSERLMDLAVRYEWKGNLRELRNFVTRTLIMRDQESAIRELESKIESCDRAASRESARGVPLAEHSRMRSIVRDIKDRTELRMIQDALNASGWNRREAAQNLRISYRALLYKIQQHHLTPGMERV